MPTVETTLASGAERQAVWIIVPAYNEAARLAATLADLAHVAGRVVVVDDGSTDETSQVAAAHDVWCLSHAFNLGQGAALQTGIDFSLAQGAKFIVTFDGDGQHAAADVAALLAPLTSGNADVALGSRFLGTTVDLPRGRRLVLKLGVLFTRAMSRIRVTDTHNGLRALTARAAREIRITHNRMAHASEILDEIRRLGLRFVEVPVTIHYRAETVAKGQSSWNALRIAGAFVWGKIVR